ncbi:MAG: sulfotransferase [Pseudomonadota bacterium]
MSTSKGRYWFDEGRKYERAGDPAGALDAYKQSLKIDALQAAPWVSIARILDQNQQKLEALQCYAQAAKVDPYNAVVRSKYANALTAAGHIEKAEAEYEAALRADEKHTPSYYGLGMLFEHKGEPEKAAGAYRKALYTDENHAQSLGNLLNLGRHIDVKDAIAQAQSLIDHLKDDKDISAIGYGLGKELERRGEDDDAAFKAYAVANQSRKNRAGPFHREGFDKRINDLCEIFSPRFFEERKDWGNPSDVPVFVVGLPRSGTTLTEQILSSHPDCYGAGEIDALVDMATGTPDRLGNNEKAWPYNADQLNKDHIQALAKDYLARLVKDDPGTSLRAIDKQPLNFFHIGLVALAFPHARIIHCHRDLRDNGFSIFCENFAPSQQWSTDLSDIAYYWQGYRRLMRHWHTYTPAHILDVRYEDTVSDLEGSTRRLLDFIDLPWDPACLSFHENERAVQTPSRWQVRQPLYKRSAGRWTRFKGHLTPLITAWDQKEDSNL